MVAPNGIIGGGDNVNMGTFTVSGSLTVQGKALMRINKDSTQSDSIGTAARSLTAEPWSSATSAPWR